MKWWSTVLRVAGRRANSIATLGLALGALLALVGCNDYGNTFQVPTGATVDFISPSNATAGGAQFTLTVTSNSGGFVAQSVVQWDGKTIPTTYVSATQLTATVAATLIAKPGTNFVNTLSPHSGAGTNGLSNTLTFIVNPLPNPTPAVSSISPNSAAAGSASFTLTINGSSFLPTSDPSGGSQVHWTLAGTQSTLPLLSASATQITATVASTLLVNATSQPVTAIVTVYNPPSQGSGAGTGSGGGESPNGLPFTITPAGTSMAKSVAASEETPAVSANGRYVAYTAIQDAHTQVLVRDTCEGAAAGCQSRTVLLSVAADGSPGNDDSSSPSMSADGRYVAFSSAATNLATGAPTGRQVYLRDTCVGAAQPSCLPSTQLISSDSEGALVGTESILPSISASGRYIAFLAVTPSNNTSTKTSPSAQAKSIAGDTTNSGFRQVFVRDTCLGAANGCAPKTTRISLQPGDTSSSNGKPAGPALSGNSSQVAVSGINSATVFTRSLAVDDRVFLALTGKQQ